MILVRSLVLMLLLAAGVCAPAGAETRVRVLSTGGYLVGLPQITSVDSGLYDVKFTAVGQTTVSVALESDEVVAFRNVSVESNRDPAAPNLVSNVQLLIRPIPGSQGKIIRVESVQPVSEDSDPDGELWITSIVTDTHAGVESGNIGFEGSTLGGMVKAHVIANVRAAKNVTADVDLLPRLTGQVGAIALVEATNGDVLGDISAPDGHWACREVRPPIRGRASTAWCFPMPRSPRRFAAPRSTAIRRSSGH